MNESAFQSYVKTFPGADPSLGALQCYVQSSGEREERMMGHTCINDDRVSTIGAVVICIHTSLMIGATGEQP